MFQHYSDFFFKPRERYPKRWSPAFVAIQLGFFAGGVGLFGRDALLFLTVQDWDLIVGFELGFAAIVSVGFLCGLEVNTPPSIT